MAQYKRFAKTCPVTAKHFTPLRILLASILLAQQFFDAQGQDEELNFLENKLVGSITPKDLKSILDGHGEEITKQKEQVFESIFKTFPRILVQYDGASGNANTTSMSLEILNMASIINQKKQENSENDLIKEPIEVWVSFSTQGTDIVADVTKILNASTQANSRFSGTVTTILLHYKGQSLTVVTLPLIKEDIRKSSQLIKRHSQGDFNFGVILGLKNCQRHSEQIKQLAAYAVDIILFKSESSAGSSSAPTPPLKQEQYENCRKKVASKYNATRTSLGFITQWPVFIDQQDDILHLNLEDKNAIKSYESWENSNNITLVLEAVLRNKPLVNKRSTNKDEENNRAAAANIDVEWLRKAVVLSKQFFGVSIVNHVLRRGDEMKTKFISRIYEKTRKIIIGDMSEATKEYQPKMQTFINEMAAFKRDIVRLKSGSGGVDIFEDQVAMRVYVSMLISKENTSASLNAIDDASDIVITGNGVYPDTVAGVVLNCDSFPLEVEVLQHWHQFIVPNIKHAKDKVSTSKGAQVGIILPFELCDPFSSVNETYPNLEMIEVIIFKINVVREEIKSEVGVVELVDRLTKAFQRCKTNTRLYFERQSETKRVEFRLNPLGCDTPYSDLQSLSNLARLWEEMNDWAVNEKTVITMDTAFEDASGNEFCGWWKVVREKGNVTFEDKKTSAMKLYDSISTDNGPKLIKEAAPSDSNFWVVIILPTMLFVVFLTAATSFLVVRFRSRYVVGKEDADGFFKGIDDKTEIESGSINMSKDAGNVTAHTQPYDKEQLEVPKACFTFDTSRSLGSGEFGLVCRGSVKKRKAEDDERKVEVAVKMINDRQGSSAQGHNRALKGLMSEIKILSYVGKHKHIISLEGAYTAELRRGRVYVFLELCQMGSLDKHLRSFEPTDTEEEEEAVVANHTSRRAACGEDRYVNLQKQNVLDDELARDLLQWSKEICCGMEYLASKKVVHADLATRNVLLTWNKCAKIADFGLSRRLYDYTNYVKKQQEPMPWRWMAPESLRRLEFNEKTDVWAFGVTMWEIYTLGDQPYPGLSWKADFVSRLEDGLRLTEPRFKEKGMFKIMKSCWESDVTCRPSFFDLSKTLKGIMGNATSPRYVNVKDIVPEYQSVLNSL